MIEVSGSESGRLKNMRIRWIRLRIRICIPNTGLYTYLQNLVVLELLPIEVKLREVEVTNLVLDPSTHFPLGHLSAWFDHCAWRERDSAQWTIAHRLRHIIFFTFKYRHWGIFHFSAKTLITQSFALVLWYLQIENLLMQKIRTGSANSWSEQNTNIMWPSREEEIQTCCFTFTVLSNEMAQAKSGIIW